MGEIINTHIEQNDFNALVLQMLMNISSRQRAYHLKIAETILTLRGENISPENLISLDSQLEKLAEGLRIGEVEQLYSQFGQIDPEIYKLLGGKS